MFVIRGNWPRNPKNPISHQPIAAVFKTSTPEEAVEMFFDGVVEGFRERVEPHIKVEVLTLELLEELTPKQFAIEILEF